MKKNVAKFLVTGFAGFGAFAAYELLLKPRMFSWGATPEELSRAYPGDELTPDTLGICTRAITIHATPEEVWPWIMQVGQDRAGFYSYSWLENVFGAEMHNTYRLVPEWQHRHVGDDLWLAAPTHYGGQARLTIARLEPCRAMVLVPHTDGALAIDQEYAPHGSWNFILEPVPGADPTKPATATRLIMRSIMPEHVTGPERLSRIFFDPAHFVMERRMMLTIKRLAEAEAAIEARKPLAPEPIATELEELPLPETLV